jgi:hypothetical protein
MASRVELPGSEHLIGDPARSKGTLHQVDHLFLRHRGRSSPAFAADLDHYLAQAT